MARQRKEPLDVLTEIIAKRQPLSLRDVRYYAHCYVAMRVISDISSAWMRKTRLH